MTTTTNSGDLIIKLPAVITAENFTDEKEFEALFAKVKETVDKHEPDVSTKGGRDAIASLAYKVARTKTALVKEGKKLTEDWRDKTKKVNAACNTIEQRLDALKEDVRRPLTEWEQAEEDRVEGHKARLASLIEFSKVGFGRPSAELHALLADAQNTPMGPDHWDEYAPQAGVAKEDAIHTLTRLIETAEKQEAEAEELERLRAEKAERDRQEAERLAAEQAKREEEERAERERQQRERIEQEARERAEREAQERVEAAERQAREAEERAQRKIAEAKEREERQAEEKRRQEEAEREERRKREADLQHRRTINAAAAKAIAECANLSEAKAQKIVAHIVTGLVPNVTLHY